MSTSFLYSSLDSDESTESSYQFDTIVLVGCHGSGKTTMGHKLSQALSWPFHDEIGRRLREQRLLKDKQAHAQCTQPDFDQEVYEQERERDQMAPTQRVIETWHPGNLAYMQARSPALFDRVFQRVQQELRSYRQRILVQPLQISIETLRSRLSEPGPSQDSFLEFLHNIGSLSMSMARELGLCVAPPIATDQHDPTTCVEMILAQWCGKTIPH